MFVSNMKTIILCGGTGTRMKEETEFKPKPMVFIGNQPILWHIMKIYAAAGFNEFILALGYKADYIKEFFLNQKAFTNDFTLETKSHEVTYHFAKDKSKDDFKITFVNTGDKTEPGERILRCKPYISEDEEQFMVTYGDAVSDINIQDLVTFHTNQHTIGTLTGVHPRSKYGLVSVGDSDKISGFVEKPVLSEWVNGGFMVFQREFFDYIHKGELEHEALKRIAEKQQLSLYKHEGFWQSMDTYKEVEDLNKLWHQEKPPWRIWK